ncbi:MAG: FAD-binding protein, partial [Alphaproteobacteria bacterium]
MAPRLKPSAPDEVAEIVRAALAERRPLEVVGGGTKRALGRASDGGAVLDLSELTGIELYEPAELVLSAGAGTLLSEIEARLAANGQQFAFEPPDYGRLLGALSGGQTIGGAVACNLAGPRRVKAGAARDHFLGVKAVSGRGEAFKAGGRVVKNVTGYDICKLLAGSYGTLAVMTSLTLRVSPAPESTRALLVRGLEDGAAVGLMIEAVKSPYEVSGAAHLPRAVADRMGTGGAGAVTAIRIEGPEPSVRSRADSLARLFATSGRIDMLEESDAQALFTAVRDVAPFALGDGRVIWRLSIPPSAAPAVTRGIAARLDCEYLIDWGGGLV